ncbi:MAG: Clp protease N-terminal domain-containing protein [bacterium]|nr:Clp protease N-terminal domain-containing protein [bacterium]
MRAFYEQGGRFKPPIEDLPVPREGFIDTAWKAMELAQEEALAANRPVIRAEDVLIGLLLATDQDGPAWQIFTNQGVDVDKLIASLRKQLALTRSPTPSFTILGEDAVASVEHANALREADDLTKIYPLHLLTALTAPRRTGIQRLTLEYFGANPELIHQTAMSQLREARRLAVKRTTF